MIIVNWFAKFHSGDEPKPGRTSDFDDEALKSFGGIQSTVKYSGIIKQVERITLLGKDRESQQLDIWVSYTLRRKEQSI